MRYDSDPTNISELSEKDVLNVLEIVRKEYTIDPARIYLLGHSMGGGGTIHLATKYPDLWAAAAPIAPALLRPVALFCATRATTPSVCALEETWTRRTSTRSSGAW